jgi:hypothetical protein
MSDLDRELDRLATKLPGWAAKTIHWVRKPGSGWMRYPLALLLIVGGFVGFLPILGFWMVPLGLVLIAEDIPFLQRPLARLIGWINDRWDARGRGRAPAPATVRRGEPGH